MEFHPPATQALLVTGGAGLIGSRVTRQLRSLGHRVVVADDLSACGPERLAGGPDAGLIGCLRRVDVSRAGVFHDLLRSAGPFDTVIHLAARVGVRRVLADPEACRKEHQAAATSLIEALAGLSHPPRVISASSSEVYCESSQPLDEASDLRSTNGTGRWAYAASKRAVELLLDEDWARNAWPVAPLHLRLFNVVGPDQDGHSGMVLPTFVRCALTGEPLPIHGPGTQVRTLGHVQDVAGDIVKLALQAGPAHALACGPLNLGGQLRCSVMELAARVAQLAGLSESCLMHVDPKQTLGSSFDEVQHRVPNLSRARRLGLAGHERTLNEVILEALQWAEQEMLRPCVLPAS